MEKESTTSWGTTEPVRAESMRDYEPSLIAGSTSIDTLCYTLISGSCVFSWITSAGVTVHLVYNTQSQNYSGGIVYHTSRGRSAFAGTLLISCPHEVHEYRVLLRNLTYGKLVPDGDIVFGFL